MKNKSLINPIATGETVEMGEQKNKFQVVKCGEELRGAWSNEQLPKIGDKVKVCNASCWPASAMAYRPIQAPWK